jgi:hypothetical protein
MFGVTDADPAYSPPDPLHQGPKVIIFFKT